jgi:hypothetical protein
MNEHDTPPDGMRARQRRLSRPDVPRDTPVKPMSSLDEDLHRYNAELDSVPPPASQLQAFEKHRVQQVHQSGSWELEALLASTSEAVKAVAARQMADEIERRNRAETRIKELEDDERTKATEDKKTRNERLFAVAMLILGGAIDRLLGFLFK